MKLKKLLLLPVFLAASKLMASSSASIDLYSAAGVSFPTLAVPVGVRAIGMGEAYTSAGNDVYTLHWNPAGMAKISGFQLGLAHNEWSSALGLRQEFLSYGQSLGQSSGFGLSVNYFSLGNLDTRDASGALQGQSGAFAFTGSGGYGWSMLDQDRLKLGLAFEFGMQTLFATSQNGFGGSLGLLYDISKEFSAGLSVNHLGTGTGGFAPPQSVNFGLSTLLLNKNLTLALDGAMPFASDPMVKAGLEFTLGVLALRGGYRYAIGAKDGDVQSGVSAGAGFKAGAFAIDYAFVPYGEISTTHRVAATIQLPDDFFKPKIIGSEATSTTAKTYYDKASDLEKKGDSLMALMQYQRAEELYPQKLRAKPQKFYLTTLQKIKDLKTEISKRGDGGQSSKLAKENVAKAQELISARRYKEAFEPLQLAKKLDPNNANVDRLMKEARSGLEDRLGGYRREARAADKAGKLAEAIDNYKKVLGVDSSDSEALSFFNRRHPEIKNLLRTVHRKGIDQYVAGKVSEAVNIWTKGRALDYFGDVDFSRDIDKAKKLLDLRGQK